MRSIIITAITLFALSGAILGFAIGAFTHARPSQQPITQHQTPPKSKSTVTQTPTVTATATAVPAQQLCGPGMSYTITPDPTTGTNVYTISVQARSQASGCNNIAVSGIASRIWLVRGKSPIINENQLKYPHYPTSLNDPTTFPNEVPNGLQFGTASQVQMTDSTGLAKWQVTLSPNLPKGNYVIVGLNDWNGIFFNWDWPPQITVK